MHLGLFAATKALLADETFGFDTAKAKSAVTVAKKVLGWMERNHESAGMYEIKLVGMLRRCIVKFGKSMKKGREKMWSEYHTSHIK